MTTPLGGGEVPGGASVTTNTWASVTSNLMEVVMFNFIRKLFRRKRKPPGMPIKWCRALSIGRHGRCAFTGRFCNPQKVIWYPCPVVIKYELSQLCLYSSGTSGLQL